MSVTSDETGHGSSVPDAVLVRISGSGEVLTRQNLSRQIWLAGINARINYGNCDTRTLRGLPNPCCAIHGQGPLRISDLIRRRNWSRSEEQGPCQRHDTSRGPDSLETQLPAPHSAAAGVTSPVNGPTTTLRQARLHAYSMVLGTLRLRSSSEIQVSSSSTK